MLQAVAAAGGFTNFATKEMFVLRNAPDGSKPVRIRFDYESVSRARGKGAGFRLRPGDVMIVE